jgi:hypothetical protein
VLTFLLAASASAPAFGAIGIMNLRVADAAQWRTTFEFEGDGA